jgi:predicted transcriptional regulator
MSLKEELQAEQVSHLDLSKFCQLAAGTLVRDALAKMRDTGSPVCLVMDDGRLAGIFTERDVLQKVASVPETWEQPVETTMTADPVTVSPDLSAADALRMIDKHHFRSLPVIDGNGHISGTMTHRAIIDFLATRYPTEVLNRPPRPGQFPRKAEGG